MRWSAKESSLLSPQIPNALEKENLGLQWDPQQLTTLWKTPGLIQPHHDFLLPPFWLRKRQH